MAGSMPLLLICIDLHLKGSTRVPGIKTDNFKSEIAELMYEPRRHRSCLDPYTHIVSRMPPHHTAAPFTSSCSTATVRAPFSAQGHNSWV